MFQGCSHLKKIKLSSFNTENVVSMVDMFNGCSSLQKIDISNFNMDKVQHLQRIFDNCPSLSKGEILVNQKSSDINDAISKVIGTADFPLYIYDPEAKDSAGKPIRIVRRMGTNLGDLIADAFKNKTGAECSFINGGGIRVNIEKGDITLSEVIDVLPFGNILCLIEVTGQQILDAMEWGCHVTPKESGGFPHVSGITFDLDTSIKDPCKVDNNGMCAGIEGERRVKNLKINGELVNPTKKYKLSTLSYIALSNGDGYTAFDGCTILEEGAAEDYTLVVDYIKNNLGGKIPDTYKDPYGEGRINIE